MADTAPTPSEIRAARAEFPKLRDRDLADQLGISEAQLVAAHSGTDATRIAADPDLLMPALETLGEVMALTRTESCVSEKTGRYANYHTGDQAAMVLNDAIDLRLFPAHWVHGFAVEKPVDGGIRRSLQVFDAAGDAVHKVFLRDEARLPQWQAVLEVLRLHDQSEALAVTSRRPPEAPKADPARLGTLREDWARMTDTHQFLRLTSKLKMKRHPAAVRRRRAHVPAGVFQPAYRPQRPADRGLPADRAAQHADHGRARPQRA
jgi:putative hemin transport protein